MCLIVKERELDGLMWQLYLSMIKVWLESPTIDICGFGLILKIKLIKLVDIR